MPGGWRKREQEIRTVLRLANLGRARGAGHFGRGGYVRTMQRSSMMAELRYDGRYVRGYATPMALAARRETAITMCQKYRAALQAKGFTVEDRTDEHGDPWLEVSRPMRDERLAGPPGHGRTIPAAPR
jgi:hypothetical protein